MYRTMPFYRLLQAMHLSISQQDSEAPYNFGRSVVPRVWSQYCIDHSVRIYANPLSQFAEVVAIPLQILLVVFRHMLCNGAILSRASFQTMVGSNAVMVVKNFNGGICYLYIHFLFDVFIRN